MLRGSGKYIIYITEKEIDNWINENIIIGNQVGVKLYLNITFEI